jgi:hypothetical protein
MRNPAGIRSTLIVFIALCAASVAIAALGSCGARAESSHRYMLMVYVVSVDATYLVPTPMLSKEACNAALTIWADWKSDDRAVNAWCFDVGAED